MNGWSLTYEGFLPTEEGLREALCTLGNGVFATRGAAPEAVADEVHYPGTYAAGVYDRLRTEIGGRSIENEDLVNLPNWLVLTFRRTPACPPRPRGADVPRPPGGATRRRDHRRPARARRAPGSKRPIRGDRIGREPARIGQGRRRRRPRAAEGVLARVSGLDRTPVAPGRCPRGRAVRPAVRARVGRAAWLGSGCRTIRDRSDGGCGNRSTSTSTSPDPPDLPQNRECLAALHRDDVHRLHRALPFPHERTKSTGW